MSINQILQPKEIAIDKKLTGKGNSNCCCCLRVSIL